MTKKGKEDQGVPRVGALAVSLRVEQGKGVGKQDRKWQQAPDHHYLRIHVYNACACVFRGKIWQEAGQEMWLLCEQI